MADQRLNRQQILKGAGALGALGAAAAFQNPAPALAGAATGQRQLTARGRTSDPLSFKYHLEASAPQRYAGGTLRTATQQNIPSLTGMALFSEQIDPGSLRELHWHPNASELNYCLSGHGTIGIFSHGVHATFAIRAGSVTFVPTGYFHYIRNTGADTLRMIATFTHESPQRIDLSALGFVPRAVLAQTFGVAPAAFPLLPQRGDRVLVKMGSTTTGAASGPDVNPSEPFTFHLAQAAPVAYEGGTVTELTATQIPDLDGITLFLLHGLPRSLREPHWHPNAAELDYVVQGRAQIEVITPHGEWVTFEVGPGDVSYIPENYFHYIASVSDEPMDMLIYFSNIKPSHVDLSETFDYFPRDVIAASFGLNQQVFARLPKRGDVFMAAKK
ncbi:MAG TPA: cupin domain-containing protein [Chloroflexota bacterium]|nr:cupin domain-containing protein [Chloroflexota bacterium]